MHTVEIQHNEMATLCWTLSNSAFEIKIKNIAHADMYVTLSSHYVVKLILILLLKHKKMFVRFADLSKKIRKFILYLF